MRSLTVLDDFQVELVAAEPLVADPVAMEVDERGRVFVLEMHGYPLDLSGSGMVKQLFDTDSDGKFDRSEVFADGLRLPTGLMAWENGLLVVDVPDLVYLEDTDGDGQADLREVVVTGFAVTNPQHIANTPVYGLDNWIYVAHQGAVTPTVSVKEFADEGGPVRWAAQPDTNPLPVDANGRSVRLRPSTLELEMLAGESQYGQTFDDWGHHFGTSNANHLFTEVIAARYLSQNPQLMVANAMEDLPDHGNAAEIFPITSRPEHQLLTDVGVITSACGVTWYQGGLFRGFENVTFVAEPVHNLVHADVVNSKGASFTAARLVENREFLASTDAWFRPVQFYIGPEGALYVIDYYRQIIEHPEWMSEEVNQSGALYNGADKGRIYRITPRGTPPMDWAGKVNLANQDAASLVRLLGHQNIWWRRHAQRLLVASKEAGISQLVLNEAMGSDSPLFLVHAMWTLDGLGALPEPLVKKALGSATAGVRENAIKLAELHLSEWPGIVKDLTGMTGDADARVRFQLMCTLGFAHGEDVERARQALLSTGIEDYWMQVAALASASGKELALIKSILVKSEQRATEGVAGFLENSAAVVTLRGQMAEVNEVIKLALASPANENSAWWKAALVRGVTKTIPMSGLQANDLAGVKALLEGQFKASTPQELRAASVGLLTEWPGVAQGHLGQLASKAEPTALNPENDLAFRKDALVILAKAGAKLPALTGLIMPSEPEPIQNGAFEVLLAGYDMQGVALVREKWPTLTPAVRDHVIGLLVKKPEGMNALLSAIEDGVVDQAAVSWPRKVRLMNTDVMAVRNRARALLSAEALDPAQSLAAYGQVLELPGSPEHGAQVFASNCAMCHQIGGKMGTSIGPDLATIRNREASFILADIIDPNRSIADGFENWTVKMKDGEVVSGVIASETAASITVRDLAGTLHTVARSSIETLTASEGSLMPPGLQNNISHEQMADLLAYLKN